MKPRRIGVLGGMFDPVHRGHLQVASLALEILALDELRMVPCQLPNHRGPAEASAQDRLAMLRLATVDEPRIVVDDRECLRAGISYTVDTLSSLREENPGAMLILVVGADAFAGLARWHRWKVLFTLAHVLIVSRPGESRTLAPVLAEEVQAREVRDVALLFTAGSGKIFFSQHLQVEISSTEVRQALQSDGSMTTFLPESVRAYVDAHALYRK